MLGRKEVLSTMLETGCLKNIYVAMNEVLLFDLTIEIFPYKKVMVDIRLDYETITFSTIEADNGTNYLNKEKFLSILPIKIQEKFLFCDLFFKLSVAYF